MLMYAMPKREAYTLFVRDVTPCADTYALESPYGTYGLRASASCVLYVPEAQGSLPQGPTHGTHVSLGRAVRAAYRVVQHRLSQHRPELRVALQLPMLSDEAGGGEGQGWPLLLLYPG